MRYLEVRRHSKRIRPEQHLSQWGVSLARGVGETIGPFDRVVTSPLPRCFDTAVAMGFAVTETIDELAGDNRLGERFPGIDQMDWDAGCAGFVPLIASLDMLAVFIENQARLWRAIVQAVPEGGSALLVGHGGAFLDGTAVFCLPQADHHVWGAVLHYCEGVRLQFDGEGFTQGEILRVEQGG